MAKLNLTKQQLYNFVKVKSSNVILDFEQDPAKNANSVILKTGTGPGDNGTVTSGLVYYLDDGVWTLPTFGSAADAGSGHLFGLALGSPQHADNGTPSQVGMLLRGVTFASLYGPVTTGAPLYGLTKAGFMGSSPATFSQVLGWCLKTNPNDNESNLVLFDPQY